MPAPMFPKPINPIFIIHSFLGNDFHTVGILLSQAPVFENHKRRTCKMNANHTKNKLR